MVHCTASPNAQHGPLQSRPTAQQAHCTSDPPHSRLTAQEANRTTGPLHSRPTAHRSTAHQTHCRAWPSAHQTHRTVCPPHRKPTAGPQHCKPTTLQARHTSGPPHFMNARHTADLPPADPLSPHSRPATLQTHNTADLIQMMYLTADPHDGRTCSSLHPFYSLCIFDKNTIIDQRFAFSNKTSTAAFQRC